MIHLKYKCKVNREITFNLNLSVLKAGFRKCPRRPQHRLPLGCEPRKQFQLTASYDVSGIHNASEQCISRTPAVRRGSHEGVYGN